MEHMSGTHRLVAILAADVSGYSRLMNENEEATISAWHSARRKVIDPTIASHDGRIVKHTGDGFLAEFSTVQKAVKCAVALQEGLVDSPLDFRMGINLGDIVDDGEDIHGDGVNIAARLEGLSEASGICISSDVYNQVHNKISLIYEDMGEQKVKNIAQPIHTYRVVFKRPIVAPLALPKKPSIAVLPFDNMSDDHEQEFFADGMAEDIITSLSRYRWFFVIARNSSFTYKGRAIDVKQVAKELGVRYVLEGSVRKAGNRMRVTAQLVDAVSGHHIWAEHYDRNLDDIFSLQDEITETIVATIEPELSAVERDRAKHKPPDNLDAWDSYQRGLWYLLDDVKREGLAEAKQLFQHACELDHEFATAYAELSYTYIAEIIRGQADDPDTNLDKAAAAAEKAVTLDARDPAARCAMGRVLIFRHEYVRAIAEMEAALDLNPNFDRAYYGLGIALLYGGRPEKSISQIERGIRLSPRSPLLWAYWTMLGLAYLNGAKYEKAVTSFEKAIQQPHAIFMPFAYAAATLGLLGRLDEASNMLAEAKTRKPEFSVDTIRNSIGRFGSHSGVERIIDGLHKVGLQ
ncbi:MAG: tetratricopeptide repeat protein [Gammaproteobacteria bacterium]